MLCKSAPTRAQSLNKPAKRYRQITGFIQNIFKVHFARHSLGGYFKLMSAEVSLKINYNYPQIESSKDRAKHDCFKNKWTLENPTVKIINFEKAPFLEKYI